jgi:hypothetical protein
MEPSLASCAQYFRIGLEIGLLEPELARDWALSVIDQMDEPPGEIIEVSWHKPLAQLITDLNEVSGEPDLNLVCAWLLGRLSLSVPSTNHSLRRAVRQAKDIVCTTGASDLYYMFDRIADGLYLAETQTAGTVGACRADFDEALKLYGTPSFSLRTS